MQKIYALALQAKESDDARQFLADKFALTKGLHEQAIIYAAGQLLFRNFPAPVQIQKVIDLWKLKPLPAPVQIALPKQKLSFEEFQKSAAKVARVSRAREKAEQEWAKLTSKDLVSDIDKNLNYHTKMAISDQKRQREAKGLSYVGPRMVDAPRPKPFCVMGEMGR